MAHLEKYKRAGVSAMLGHYSREFEGTKKRSNIDSSKTEQNYIVQEWRNHFKSASQLADMIKLRIEQAKAMQEYTTEKKLRKDAVMLMDWVITLPKDCPEWLAEQFFQETYSFVRKRYNNASDNVPGGFVHMDESTPHIHIPVIPRIDRRFQASKMVGRTELLKFHKDLQKHLDTVLPVHVSVMLPSEEKERKLLSQIKATPEEMKMLDIDGKIETINALKAEEQEVRSRVQESLEIIETLKKNYSDIEKSEAEIRKVTQIFKKHQNEIDMGLVMMTRTEVNELRSLTRKAAGIMLDKKHADEYEKLWLEEQKLSNMASLQLSKERIESIKLREENEKLREENEKLKRNVQSLQNQNLQMLNLQQRYATVARRLEEEMRDFYERQSFSIRNLIAGLFRTIARIFRSTGIDFEDPTEDRSEQRFRSYQNDREFEF